MSSSRTQGSVTTRVVNGRLIWYVTGVIAGSRRHLGNEALGHRKYFQNKP
jgi:hypothetical protein